MTLRDAYEHVQRRKSEVSFDEWPPALVPVVAQVAAGVKAQLGTDDPRVIEAALVGMAWVCQMLHEEDVDVQTALDVPVEIADNVLGNVPPRVAASMTQRQSVELGIGAGFYTGLWAGMLMRDAV